MVVTESHEEPEVAELLAGGTAGIAHWTTSGDRLHRRLTPADVGHAFAGRLLDHERWSVMPEGPYRLVWCRYVEPTPRDVRLLMEALTRDCEPLSGWWARQPYWTYCRVAVTEYLSPDACLACTGTGSRRVGDSYAVCSRCEGVGRRSWSVRRRADALGVARSTFGGGPAEAAYTGRLRRLAVWDSEGLAWVRARVRGRDC